MHKQSNKVARAITRFVENPVTNLVKGMALLLIGLSEATRTLTDDLADKRFSVGHGLIIIGIFGVLGALPQLIDGLEASQRYLDFRGERALPRSDPGVGHDRADDRAH